MKLKQLVLAAGLVTCSVMGALSFGPSTYAAVNCPEYTVRSGQSAKTYAECNLPPDDGTGNEGGLMGSVMKIINVIIGVLGVGAVIAVILGGIGFVSSQGDAQKTAKAKNAVLYGLIGLVVAMLSFAIVMFLLNNVFGSGGGSNTGSRTNNTTTTSAQQQQQQGQQQEQQTTPEPEAQATPNEQEQTTPNQEEQV